MQLPLVTAPLLPALIRPGLRFRDFKNLAMGGFGDANNCYAHSMSWFQDHLYVGTTRANLCMLKNSVSGSIISIDNWPVDCPHRPYESEFERSQGRAEIWRYSPATGQWAKVYRAPLVTGSHGEPMSRDLGYRGMVQFKGESDRSLCLYLTNWSRSNGDGPTLLRCEDGETFEEASQPKFGDMRVNSIRTLVPFNGRLFVAPTGSGKGNPNVSLPVIYKSSDPRRGGWRLSNQIAFGDNTNRVIFEMAEFNGYLYAGTGNNEGCQVWRTRAEGHPPYLWEKVIDRGASRGSLNQCVVSMIVFKESLYIGTGIQNGGYDHVNKIGPAGAEIFRINGDGSWDLCVGDSRPTPHGFKASLSGLPAGFGNFFSGYLWRMEVHDGWLYAGTMEWSVTLRYADLSKRPHLIRKLFETVGAENIVQQQGGFDLWRSSDGAHWVPVSKRGFDNPYNYGVRTMVSTPHGLFLGTANPFGPRVAKKNDHGTWHYEDNPRGGCEVWLGSRVDAGTR
jgi:hypothetical protein